MSRKFKVWLNSGANAFSRFEVEVSIDDIGLSDSEFDAMSEDQKDDIFRDFAFQMSDWGWLEK